MRLIDADELINQGYEIVVDGLQYDTCNKSIDIDDIQTTYDIEKVIEKLEEVAYVDEDVNSFIDLEDAIEIVK